MALGWLNVLKLVPWSDVLNNAPKAAEGAKRLWESVGGKPSASFPSAGSTERMPETTGAVPMQQAELTARLVRLEAAAADLHRQMQASSGLIKTLAEQNAQLVARVASGRVRLRVVSALAGVSLVMAIGALVVVLAG